MRLVFEHFAEYYRSLLAKENRKVDKDMSSLFFPFFKCGLFLNTLQSIIVVFWSKRIAKWKRHVFFILPFFLGVACFCTVCRACLSLVGQIVSQSFLFSSHFLDVVCF